MSLLRRVLNLFSRRAIDREIEAELESHIALRTDDNVAAGMPTESARRNALVRFGNRSATRERVAGVESALVFSSVWTDIRYAGRQLVKNPGFAATAILVLALGIGASVAIFAFVDAALIKPLPYRQPSRLAALFESMTLGARFHISYADYVDWKRLNSVFTSVDVYQGTSLQLANPSGAEHVDGTMVSGGFFRTLGVKPILGRDFAASEELPNGPRAVVLSYGAWQRRFGGRTDAIGRSVTLDGNAHTIIGVLPADFHFAPDEPSDFWTAARPEDSCSKARGCHNFAGIARLKDGVTMQAAAADMTRIADQLARQYPDDDAHRGATVLPLTELIVGDLRPILLVLLGGAALLLLIACVNDANLLLVRSESRKREIAVRGAMGASPARLVRQLVTEGLVLVGAGTLLGLASAQVAIELLLGLIPQSVLAGMPYLRGLGVNLHVITFALALAVLASLLFSLIPALRLSRAGSGTAMRDALAAGGRGFAGTLWRRFGANLVVVELAMAMVLLVCAGLLAKSFYKLLHTSIGLDPDHLAALRVEAPEAGYSKDANDVALARQVEDRVARLPGVDSVGISVNLPVGRAQGSTTFRVVGRPYHGERVEVLNREVDPGYFKTIGARILRGRNFTADDDASHPLAMVINQAMVRRHFPDEDPIGKKIVFDATSPAYQIVGVVNDIQEGQLDSVPGPVMYLAFAQNADRFFYIVVRTSLAEQAMLPTLAETVREIDPSIATAQPTVMSERIHDSPAAYLHRSSAWLVGGFAAMALLLGVVGLYGVIAYSVSRRTREIGVRMALGAERGSVYSLILKEAAWLIAAGVAAGLACSVAAAVLMRKLLFGTEPWDASTLAAVAAVLALCALMASFIPARRAASVNPVEALRAE
jgi:macrolide transport system ATP-binding/permease protein